MSIALRLFRPYLIGAVKVSYPIDRSTADVATVYVCETQVIFNENAKQLIKRC